MKKKMMALAACTAMTLQAGAQNSELMESLSGVWMLEASNNGVAVEIAPGVNVYRATTDTIFFTATPSADGTALECHTDSLYWRSGTAYPADWRITVEENGDGQYRVGWVLTTAQPVSSKEFQETADKYLEDGFFYWGSNNGGHRYLYLLGENEDNTAFISMTLWGAWTATAPADAEHSLQSEENNARKMYAIVAEDIPYGHSVGYVEIWGSPKIRKVADSGSAGIRETVAQQAAVRYYDLQGREVVRPASRGLYILSNKKKGFYR